MKQQIAKVTSSKKITHDVLQIVTVKPEQFTFVPGQATEISINKADQQNEKRPFTFTSLPENDYLEFTIKTYSLHAGVTNQLLQLKENDELILHDVFGAISYKGEGVFVAGGAGVTPFISIFRHLRLKNEIGKNRLIFANKTKRDIILEDEFKEMLGNNFISILSEEQVGGYAHGTITEQFLESNSANMNRYFYLCGPPPMVEAIEKHLIHLKTDKKPIVKEIF